MAFLLCGLHWFLTCTIQASDHGPSRNKRGLSLTQLWVLLSFYLKSLGSAHLFTEVLSEGIGRLQYRGEADRGGWEFYFGLGDFCFVVLSY